MTYGLACGYRIEIMSKGNENLKLLNGFEWSAEGQMADCCVDGEHSGFLKVKGLPATRKETRFIKFVA